MSKTSIAALVAAVAAGISTAVLAQGAPPAPSAQPAQAPAVDQEAKAQIPAKPAPPAKQRQIPVTIMFSTDDLNDIQSHVTVAGQDKEKSNEGDAIEKATLYLSTILYSGPNSWTIWVNGKPIGPNDEFSSFKITDIGPRFVELLVPLSAQGMHPVRLEPNQTFIAKSGAVVEGVWKQ